MRALDGLVRIFELVSPQYWLIDQPRDADADQQLRWVRNIDLYVTGWVILEIGMLVAAANLSSLAWKVVLWFLAGLRLAEIIQVAARIYIFDHLRGEPSALVTCVSRSLVLSFINYLEIALCFATLYRTVLYALPGAGGWASTLYFSLITQLTVGYGDVHPIRVAKALASVQALLGLVFAVIIVARFVSSLPRIECRIHPHDGKKGLGAKSDEVA